MIIRATEKSKRGQAKNGGDRPISESLTEEVMKQKLLEPQDRRREQQTARVVDVIH